MQRMAPVDAMFYWLSATMPNDQFLVYCFAATDDSTVLDPRYLLERAARVADLNLRVRDVPWALDRPYWVRARPAEDQIVVHDGATNWAEALELLATVMATPLQPARAAWRLHVIGGLEDNPDTGRPAMMVVFQASHALGDGRRASQIARELLGGVTAEAGRVEAGRVEMGRVEVGRCRASWMTGPVTAALGVLRFPFEMAETVVRGAQAYRLDKDSVRSEGYRLTELNRPAGGERLLRVLVRRRGQLCASGVSVTVAVLAAISVALPAHLGDKGRPFGVELTMGREPRPGRRNNFRNVGVDLFIDEPDLAVRARRIGAAIAAARAADADPGPTASRRAWAATPAVLAHWGTTSFDPYRKPSLVTGVTVVSSVDRGPADLYFGGGRVLFTTGFPALSPAQGLTHGVHGIGESVAVSVTTAPEVMPDVDSYLAALERALVQVRRACGNG